MTPVNATLRSICPASLPWHRSEPGFCAVAPLPTTRVAQTRRSRPTCTSFATSNRSTRRQQLLVNNVPVQRRATAAEARKHLSRRYRDGWARALYGSPARCNGLLGAKCSSASLKLFAYIWGHTFCREVEHDQERQGQDRKVFLNPDVANPRPRNVTDVATEGHG